VLALKPSGEAIRNTKQSGGEPDKTEEASDFCDFGYDVVSSADRTERSASRPEHLIQKSQ
jgi:hypothetical protein